MSDLEPEESEQDVNILNLDKFDKTLAVACPECGLSGNVPAEWEGRTAECRECGQRFTVRGGDQ